MLDRNYNQIVLIMDKTKKYSFGLAISLIFFFTIGNILRSVPNTLSTFPDLLSMLPIPVLIYFYLRSSKKSGRTINLKNGFHLTKEVVLNAALLFAIFTFVYSLFYYGNSSYLMAGVSFLMAIIGTVIVSIISILLCSWLIQKDFA